MARRHFTVAAALVALMVPAVGLAGVDDDPEAKKLSDGGSPRYTVPVPGTDRVAGGSMCLVHAPIAIVRHVVQDYAHYQTFLPNFEKSRVVAKKDGNTDVYVQVALLHGAVSLWSLTRFAPPVKDAATSEHIDGTRLDGNMDDFRTWWRLRAVDDEHTVLKLELFAVPKLPVPVSVITEELQVSADRAVVAARARSEKKAEEKRQNAQK